MKKRILLSLVVFILILPFVSSLRFVCAENNCEVKKDANVRKGPSVQYPVITTVRCGMRLKKLEQTHGWYKVRLSDGTEAWIAASLIKDVQPVQPPNAESGEIASEWVNVDASRSAESFLMEIAQKVEAGHVQTLVYDSSAGEKEFLRLKGLFRSEKNKLNSQWEKSLRQVEHSLNQDTGRFTINELQLVRLAQNTKILELENKNIAYQIQHYNNLLKSLKDNLKKAKRDYRSFYENYRKYFVALGHVQLSYKQSEQISPQDVYQEAFRCAVEQAEKRGIGTYIEALETLKNENYYRYIKAVRSAVAYKLGPGKQIIQYEEDDKGSPIRTHYFVLSPICIQPKPAEAENLQASKSATMSIMHGIIVYDPAEPLPEGSSKPIQSATLLNILNEDNRKELEASEQEFIQLIKQYYDKDYKAKWLTTCKSYGNGIHDINSQIGKYKTVISTNSSRIEENQKEIAKLKKKLRVLCEEKTTIELSRNENFKEWQNLILHRTICHFRSDRLNCLSEERLSDVYEKLSRTVFKKALNESMIIYADSVGKYVFENEVSNYVESREISERPGLIKAYKIICKGVTSGSIRNIILAAGFKFDLNLPDKYLRRYNPFEEESIRATMERRTNNDGQLQYLSFKGLAWKVPSGGKYSFKTWASANGECVKANQAQLCGCTNWRLPTRQELQMIKSRSKGKCCIFDELKIDCAAYFWTYELAKKEPTVDSYYTERFGFKHIDTEYLSEDAAAYIIMVADLPDRHLDICKSIGDKF
jgi:hypothetical protein